jgi:hypothetical protein
VVQGLVKYCRRSSCNCKWTGGGGGSVQAGDETNAGGNGGSGVVILRMADADYSSTTTGSPTVNTGCWWFRRNSFNF